MTEKSSVVFRICQPNEMLAIIANLDLLIGMRLHSLIFAAQNAVPMLGLSYDPKVAAFMKSIDQLVIDAGQIHNSRYLKELLPKLINERVASKNALRKKRDELRELAGKSFQLFTQYFRRKPARQ
ncbi:hypothetical protein A3J44_00135 [candidate division WOR-1 bacterium RIFCSPHIGHO2_02_FULL_45_12]|nr:MAG: hypothetical protein A3J44_00135 [candidate division WOR-1 bacterium RIFCSPHIGHO2_02_FULL_45_12]